MNFLGRYTSADTNTEKHRGLKEHNPKSPLSVHAMTVAYQQRPVLWDVDYDAPVFVDKNQGALVGIVGPNGAGKTTFIKACLGLLPLLSGSVTFWGDSYLAQRKNIAYVPQRESVDWDFPISALEVVCMGRYAMIGWCRSISKAHLSRSREFLDLVGMADFADRQINQLSGGQQQRVFLARALAQEATLYFMDEPFAGVDAATEKTIVEVLRTLRGQGKTVFAVHHDLLTVPEYFDHAVLINTRIVAAGETKTVFNDENLKRTYGGRLTLLDEVSQRIARSSL